MMNYCALLTNWKFDRSLQIATLLWIAMFANSAVAQIDSAHVDSLPAINQIDTKLGAIQGESLSIPSQEVNLAKVHSPKTAAIRSAILPGLGQAYNKKYWKIPIIYGGFAVAGWYLHDNLSKIRLYKAGIIAENDGDPNTTNDTGYNVNQLFQLVDQHKQWRDLSYLAIAAIYVLNIVDASVDAHLFYFDISPDLSLKIDPYYNPMPANNSIGLALTFKL